MAGVPAASGRPPMLPRSEVALAASLTALASAAGAPAAQEGADPFTAGQRWSSGPAAGAPWIARDVAFAAGGELLWAAPAVGTPHLALYASGAVLGSDAPLFSGPSLPGAIGVVPVAAGDGAGELYAAPQFPDPDPAHRRTELVRYDALASALSGTFAPKWTYVPPFASDGPALLAADDDGGLVLALRELAAAGGLAHVAWIAPANGAVLSETEVAGGPLGALRIAQGGARVALTAGLELWLLDRSGAALHHETLAAATSCLALSAAGDVLVTGGFAGARVLVEGPRGAFAEAFTVPAAPGEIAATAALSADGSTLAVGFWSYTSGTSVRVETRDVATGAALHSLAWNGPGGLQNYPQELALTPDGARIAIGLWGQGGPEPELVLLERTKSEPLHAWSLPGSVLALDLDASGTRIGAAVKDSHANQFATTGTVRLFDTGERDLQLVAPAWIGGVLALEFQKAGMLEALFALGTPAAAPRTLCCFAGVLLLDAALPLVVVPAPAVEGRAALAAPIPDDPALIGVPAGIQAAALGASASFSSELVRPQFL